MAEGFTFEMNPTDPSKVTGAFGFSEDINNSPAIERSLQRSKEVTDLLTGNLNSGLMSKLATSAAFGDQLLSPVVQNIQTTLGNAAATLGIMQSPIEQGIVTQLSSAGGNTVALGGNLPVMNVITPDPLCVQIRKEASAGMIATALDFARGNILPFTNPKTAEYYTASGFIDQCLSGYPQVQQQFYAALATLENEPTFGGSAGATVTQSLVGIPPSTQTYNILPATGTVITGSHPETQPIIGLPGTPIGGAVIGSGAPPSSTIPTAGAPSPAAYIPGSGAGPSGLTQPAYSTVGSGAPPQQFGVPTYAPTPGVTQRPNTGSEGGSICTNQYGASWIIPPGMVCGSGPPPGYATPPAEPTYPYQPPVTQPPPTQPPPPYTSPPPPPPPPPKDCIKICPTEPPKCDDKKYCVWQNVETSVCYVTLDTDKPRFSSDRKIICGVPSDSWVNAICSACNATKSTQPPSLPGVAAPGFQQLVGCDNLFKFQTLTTMLGDGYFQDAFGKFAADLKPIYGCGPQVICDALNAFRTMSFAGTGAFTDAIVQLLSSLVPLNCSGTPGEGLTVLTRALVGLFGRFFGGVTEPAETSLAYNQNTLCPFRIPSPETATTSWLADNIDLDRLRCIVEANGNRWDSWFPVADAARAKLSIGEYAQLQRRKVINQQQYRKKLRESGVLRDDDADWAFELTHYIPNPSDIISMMIRDAADTVNINWKESDRIFVDKYADPLSKWGEQQGIDEEFMRMLWRAHWRLPSPGQANEMLHRNSRLDPGNPAFVDMKRVRQVLLQQDIHPDWLDAFIAISYSPLTRIDARRAYEIGALDITGLKEAYLNLGYNDSTADTLVNFNVLNARRTIVRNPNVSKYAAGELNTSELYDALRMAGARDADLPVALERGTLLLRANRRKRCVNAIRKRYMTAEISKTDAQLELQSQGLDSEQVNEISAGMECERNAKGKVFTGNMILSLFKDGIIQSGDAFDRLLRIGYDEDEATLLIQQAALRIQLKLDAANLKNLKQQQRDAEKLRRALRQQAADEQAAAAKREASAERARKTKELREKRLLEAAKLVSYHTGMEFSDAVYFVRNLHAVVSTSTAATIDESINAIGVAASDIALTTPDAITAAVSVSIAALA